MGVSGSGKTTLAATLAERLGYTFAEADDYHPRANVEKMSAGIPLTDADREPWLRTLSRWLQAEDVAGRSSVMTCSALKRRYRDILREGLPDLIFIHLDGSLELLSERMVHRIGHFMPASLLRSQLQTLEALEPDEHGIVFDVGRSPEELVAAAQEFVTT